MTDADVAVVGLGAWGSQALWRLADRGLRVIGIDAHDVPNALGSSHGHTRLFRVACHEHIDLPPLARLSAELLRRLEHESGSELLSQSGLLSIGPPDGRAIKITSAAIDRAGIAADRMDIAELRRRYPQHAGLGDDYVGILDHEAGLVAVEESITAAVTAARSAGAETWTGTAVTGIDDDSSGVTVSTASGRIRVGQVVLTAGPWMAVLQDLVALQVYRTPMLLWQAAADPDAFAIGRFPAFIRHYDQERTIWGHGSTPRCPVKVGLSDDVEGRPEIHPDQVRRSVNPADDAGRASRVVATALPGLAGQPTEIAPCMITNSPDRQFVIGRAPERSRMILAGGCSGHGFKHAAGIGEVIAGIAAEEAPAIDISFLDPARFS